MVTKKMMMMMVAAVAVPLLPLAARAAGRGATLTFSRLNYPQHLPFCPRPLTAHPTTTGTVCAISDPFEPFIRISALILSKAYLAKGGKGEMQTDGTDERSPEPGSENDKARLVLR